MSEGRVQPCLSCSAFKVMSLMTCPFCCMPPLTGRLCRQTQATSLGQILIVLNRDRKSTRLNSSHEWISYAVFCLKKKKKHKKHKTYMNVVKLHTSHRNS